MLKQETSLSLRAISSADELDTPKKLYPGYETKHHPVVGLTFRSFK